MKKLGYLKVLDIFNMKKKLIDLIYMKKYLHR